LTRYKTIAINHYVDTYAPHVSTLHNFHRSIISNWNKIHRLRIWCV